MIKQIFKIIWAQRRNNGWIFAELLIITGVLWIMLDGIFVKMRIYNSPLGYDFENVYFLHLSNLNTNSAAYVPETERTSTEAEDLLQLMQRIRTNPEIEDVCVSYYSAPYSWGDSRTSLYPVEGDTTTSHSRSFQSRRVSPEFFKVFRVKDKKGNLILPEEIPQSGTQIIITADLEKLFFQGQEGKGRQVKLWQDSPHIKIHEVSEPIRASDYQISEPSYFLVLNQQEFPGWVKAFGASGAEMCVRMKQYKTPEEMHAFLADISEQLTVNNLYVYGMTPLETRRKSILQHETKQLRINIILLMFMMVNVFFGIIGTFWLRTQYRKGEIGLRVALGSDKAGIYRFMSLEGLCLLATTIPFFIFFAVNIFAFNLFLDTDLPGTFLRYLCSIGGTYLLIAGMILLGISFPSRKAVKMSPAEALHYE